MVGMLGLLLGPLLLMTAFPANTSLNELRASDASNCQVLNSTICADICVSRKEGSKRKQFTCGDWWTTSDCCNGTQGQSFTTVSVFYDCRCRCTFSSLSIRQDAVRTHDGFVLPNIPCPRRHSLSPSDRYRDDRSGGGGDCCEFACSNNICCCGSHLRLVSVRRVL
jgi:hypothetical protein